MTETLHLDWESRGVLDLREVGLHNYARDKDTDLWLGAYAFGDEEPLVWYPGQPCPPRIVEHVLAGGEVHAWNAPFEIEMWQQIATPRHGWPELKPEQAHCVMARSYAMGLPGALEDAALAVGLQILKDSEGRSLMLRLARPRSVKPLVWWSDKEKIVRLAAYSQQDVRVERELHKRLLPLSEKERAVWLLDYRINQRGVQLDIPSVRGAIALTEKMKVANDEKLAEITGGAVRTVSAVAAFKEWLAANGAAMESLAKQAVADRLVAEPPLAPAVRSALLLRQESAKSSVAKFDVMEKRAGADGRLRQMYQYHGAATGRWAGRGVQTHNLPRNMPSSETVEHILGLVREGNHEAIDVIYGPPLSMVSGCLRSFFTAAPGHTLIAGDFANVESRGAAWFCNEKWKMDAFIAADKGTGPDVYSLGASRLLGIPVEQVTKEQRQSHGKVPDLAFQYQGGVGSGHMMGKTYGVYATDEEWNDRKNKWRASHPKIKQTWFDIQNAAIKAVQHPGTAFECGFPGRQAKFKMVGSFLWYLLPSGRALCYPYPKLLEGKFGPQLTAMTVPSQEDRRKGKIIDDARNSNNWARIGLYGGSIFNHTIQGLGRDLLADRMLYLDSAGASIALHTHDSIAIEVPLNKAVPARAEMERAMNEVPAWAAGFPLFTKCDAEVRFRG